MPSSFTVPVALDSTPPPAGSDSLVRLIYFRITAEDPNTRIFFGDGFSNAFPFILLGLEGIVLGPVGGQELFQSPLDIVYLINFIEAVRPDQSDDPHAFGTSSIWLPYTALEQSKAFASRREVGESQVERGDVFRLAGDAFRKAWWYLDGRVDEHAMREFFRFESESSEAQQPRIAYSPIETQAFRRWAIDILGGQTPLGLTTP